MDYINRICDTYQGNILLSAEYKGEKAEYISDEIYSILCVSNGIKETMFHPKTNEKIAIAWILYTYDMMMEQTAFYNTEYNIEGVVFADDGAGNPYILKPDGKVMCYNAIDDDETEVADTLLDFWSK